MFLCLARDYPLALGTVEPNSVDIHQGDTGDLAFVFLDTGQAVAEHDFLVEKKAHQVEVHPDHNIAVVGDNFLREQKGTNSVKCGCGFMSLRTIYHKGPN